MLLTSKITTLEEKTNEYKFSLNTFVRSKEVWMFIPKGSPGDKTGVLLCRTLCAGTRVQGYTRFSGMKTLPGYSTFIIAISLTALGCSSTHSISRSAIIPFGQQHVYGVVVRLSDSLFPHTRMDTIAITQFDPVLRPSCVDFHVIQADTVTISFYDSDGRLVNNAYRNYLPPGIYRFEPTDFHVNEGAYFIKCQVGDRYFTTKTLVR